MIEMERILKALEELTMRVKAPQAVGAHFVGGRQPASNQQKGKGKGPQQPGPGESWTVIADTRRAGKGSKGKGGPATQPSRSSPQQAQQQPKAPKGPGEERVPAGWCTACGWRHWKPCLVCLQKGCGANPMVLTTQQPTKPFQPIRLDKEEANNANDKPQQDKKEAVTTKTAAEAHAAINRTYASVVGPVVGKAALALRAVLTAPMRAGIEVPMEVDDNAEAASQIGLAQQAAQTLKDEKLAALAQLKTIPGISEAMLTAQQKEIDSIVVPEVTKTGYLWHDN